jgi:hypothetical protein
MVLVDLDLSEAEGETEHANSPNARGRSMGATRPISTSLRKR